ncbi:MAG: dephospho-CoA kinase [Cellulosilyticaceae bacterium]
MKVLGIVGGIGAGKTTVVSMITEIRKTYVINADQIGHQLLLKEGKAYQRVIDAFGIEILDEEGNIIRARLGALVFSDSNKLLKLNQISHPLIYQEVKKQVEQCQEQGAWELVVIDAALLIEIGLIELVDDVVGVYADEETRIIRVMAREKYSREDAKKRIASQKDWNTLEQLSDYIIDNSLSYPNTKEQVENMMKNW